jgi:4-amino-4-deoxy-L-arabinose transferase-like glycosyltransferase
MTEVAAPSRLAALVDFARREPGRCLAAVLVAHVVIWTALPALLSHNLQLDLAEDLALGREWQLGYWKHPPLPWWLADLAYRVVGDVRAVYLLGPLSAAVCMYAVWLLGRDIVGGSQALIAVLALEGLHFFNFSVPKFAHDQMQLPFWALTGLFLYRAIARERALDWLAAGAALALCFWSKYAAFALAGSLGLFMLLDPTARRTLLTPGPWLMALAFLLVIAPNFYWLVDTGYLPLRYVDARAKMATHWYHFVSFPLQWSASQLGYLAPTIALMGRTRARADGSRQLRTPLRHDAGARAVRDHDLAGAGARPAAGRDVGLSAVVIRAPRRADLARPGDRCGAAQTVRGRLPGHLRRDAARLCGHRRPGAARP